MLGAAGLGEAQPGMTWVSVAAGSLGLSIGMLPDDLAWQEVPLALDIARLTAPLALIWLVAGLLRHALGNRYALARMRARGEHLIVAGDGALARMIVMGELARHKPVVILGNRIDAPWIGPALRDGAAICPDLAKCGLESARALAFTGPEGADNLALARQIVAGLHLARPAGNPLEIIVSTSGDDGLPPDAEDGTINAQARVRQAILSDMVARRLFLDHTLDAFRWSDVRDATVFVIGLTDVTRLYIARVLTGGHWRGGRKAKLVVIDTEPRAAQATIADRHGKIDALSPIAFVRWDGTEAQIAPLVTELHRSCGRPVAYIIDAGPAAMQREWAERIVSIHAEADIALPPIHARIDAGSSAAMSHKVTPFGYEAVLADPDALMQEQHDLTARAIHESYLEGRLGDGEKIGARDSLREWEDLPERYRADNRMVADCYQLKLRDIGCRIVSQSDRRFPPFRLRHDEEEDLARAEHDRWMVAKVADGWRFGPVRDDAERLHPDIVPFDDLSEEIKDLDREQVRLITRIVARQGKAVVRLLEVGLIPGGAPCPSLAPLIAALKIHYPDRLPRFLVEARSAEAIAALKDEGALIHLVASGFAIPAYTYDAVTAVPLGGELEVLNENADLRVLCGDAAAQDGTPVIRLNREGTIVQAPWLP